jgi:hypothetical protein
VTQGPKESRKAEVELRLTWRERQWLSKVHAVVEGEQGGISGELIVFVGRR